MDWSQIITELGGGPTAVGIAALGFLYWKERQRSNSLVERLIDKADSQASETLAREKETITTLNNLAAAIKGGV